MSKAEGLDKMTMAPAISSAPRRSLQRWNRGIGVGQSGLTHLHITKVATTENTASKVGAIEVGILEVAFIEFGPLKYAESALCVALISTREEQVAPFGFSEA